MIREALHLEDWSQGMRPVILLLLTIKSLCIPRNIKIRCRCIEIRLYRSLSGPLDSVPLVYEQVGALRGRACLDEPRT